MSDVEGSLTFNEEPTSSDVECSDEWSLVDMLSSEDENLDEIQCAHSDVIIISDDEADVNDDKDGRELGLSQVRKVTQTVTLTFRKTITHV